MPKSSAAIVLAPAMAIALAGAGSARASCHCVIANGKIAFTSNRDGNDEIYVMKAAAAALALGLWIGVARAADQRLDEADLALQKAAALLMAAQSSTSDPKVQHRFDKAVAWAIGNIDRAWTRIVDAQEAVDNP